MATINIENVELRESDLEKLKKVVYEAVVEALFSDTYEVYSLPLTTRRELYEINILRDLGIKAKKIYILRADDKAYIRLNNPKNPQIEAVPDLPIDFVYISKLYIDNPPSSDPNAKLVIIVFG